MSHGTSDEARAPGPRAWIPFGVGMLAVVAWLPFYMDPALGEPLAPLTGITARGVREVLALVGVAAVWDGSVLHEPGGFGYEVIYRCTGLLPSLFLVVAIATSPGPGRQKPIGILLGVSAILILNQIRLAHLFQVGRLQPDLFDFFHRAVWESAIVAAVLAAWLGWVFWAIPSYRRALRPGR